MSYDCYSVESAGVTLERLCYESCRDHSVYEKGVRSAPVAQDGEKYFVHIYLANQSGYSIKISGNGRIDCKVSLKDGTKLNAKGIERINGIDLYHFFYEKEISKERYLLKAFSSNEAYGTVSPNQCLCCRNDLVKLTATPKRACSFGGWFKLVTDKKNGMWKIGPTWEPAGNTLSKTVTKLGCEEVYKAEFSYHTLECISSNPSMGTVTPSGKEGRCATAIISLTAKPKENYTFVGWYKLEKGERVFVSDSLKIDVKKQFCDEVYIAVFDQYVLNCTSGDPNLGSVMPNGSGMIVVGGQKLQLTAVPKNKYVVFGGWYVKSSNTKNKWVLVSNSLSMPIVVGCSASYEACFMNHKVSVSSADTSLGTVNDIRERYFVSGQAVGLCAYPKPGCHFCGL